jgi:hypothetical protein
MKVYVCVNNWEDCVEGVFTEEGMLKFKEGIMRDALAQRDLNVQTTQRSIDSIKAVRQPAILKSEELLAEEKELKAQEKWAECKAVHKRRKMVLREIDRLNLNIHDLEERCVCLRCMTDEELLREYSGRYYFEEHYLRGD